MTRSTAELLLPLLAPAAPGVARQVRTRWDGRQLTGEWVSAGPGRSGRSGMDHVNRADGVADLAGAVLLYLHGSGYMACSPRTHRGLVAALCARAGMPAFVPSYRLAPRHRFPSATEDALAAYRWLRSIGYPPERIVIAGDSAGGHMALGTCIALRHEGDKQPAGLALFSPLVDPTFATAADRDRIHHDPYLASSVARRMLALYSRGVDIRDPRYAPLSGAAGALRGLPPMLVQAGTREALSADAEAVAAAVVEAGGRCRLEMWRGQPHVFQMLYLFVPEARRALTRAAEFLRTCITRPDAVG